MGSHSPLAESCPLEIVVWCACACPLVFCSIAFHPLPPTRTQFLNEGLYSVCVLPLCILTCCEAACCCWLMPRYAVYSQRLNSLRRTDQASAKRLEMFVCVSCTYIYMCCVYCTYVCMYGTRGDRMRNTHYPGVLHHVLTKQVPLYLHCCPHRLPTSLMRWGR